MGRILSSRWFYFGLAALLAVVALYTQVDVKLPARSFGNRADIAKIHERGDLNVVFILIDTLRADHLSSYGYGRETTPTMDRLAATGVRFADTVAQSSWTKCSMASIWTGTYPQTNGVTRYDDAIPEEAVLPAEIFKKAGYRTAGVFRNGWVGATFGFDQGWDLYTQPSRLDVRDNQMQRRTRGEHHVPGNDWDTTSSAIEYIKGNAHAKFMLYIHYMDVHQYVYEQRSAKFGSQFMDSYDNAINWVDRNVGAVVEELERQGVMDHTLVVIAADHGEAFGEHGTEGHAKNLYKEVIQTPLFFVLPFFVEGGVVVPEMVENIDIWPTILDLAGLDPLPGAEGHSLVPLMAGLDGATAPSAVALSHLDMNWGGKSKEEVPIVAVTQGDHRLIYAERPEEGEEKHQLFNHVTDPREAVDVSSREPAVTDELEDVAKGYLAADHSAWAQGPKKVHLDDMRLGILKALGYVVGPEGPERVGVTQAVQGKRR